MGLIRIDRVAAIELDDGLLDHVFAVIIAKLRRHEPVLLQWVDPEGHSQQVFVNPSCALIAQFGTEERAPLDHAELERLMIAANSTGGICLTSAAHPGMPGEIPSAHAPSLAGPHAAIPHGARVN
ncbi:hypothetical protein ACFPER_10365 [Agromyces aurantiacus]|uniref:DUF7882 domain-containing protein n=1 Tax=Agromyces aurantiacus TaxID=165814 RepID=A0ABV9R516_9MICO|nr:hypothetical protein [Agromyces aurantiacus]MBM7503881.1 hypothetical protein [Agromyces aurantiacus]